MITQGSESLLELYDTLIIPLLNVQEVRLNPIAVGMTEILPQEERLKLLPSHILFLMRRPGLRCLLEHLVECTPTR